MHGDDILVLVEKCDHCLAFHNLSRSEPPERIQLASYPHEVVTDPDRRLAFVGHYGVRTGADAGVGGDSVFVVDVTARKLVNTLDCRPYTRIHGLAVDNAGRLYALSEATGVLLVFDHPLEDKLPSRAVVTGGLKSHLISVTRDGGRAFSMNLLTHTVTRLAPHDPTVAPVALMLGIQPEGNCLSEDQATLFVTNRGSGTVTRIDVAAFTVEAAAPVRPDPTRVYLAGDGRLLVTHFNGRAISVLDAASLCELAHLQVNGRPAAACLHPGRSTAYVSLETGESLEIDLADMRIVARRPTGNEPDACFVAAG